LNDSENTLYGLVTWCCNARVCRLRRRKVLVRGIYWKVTRMLDRWICHGSVLWGWKENHSNMKSSTGQLQWLSACIH